MAKWTEVSAYSGMPVDEDAPTVHTGPAIAGTGDDSSVVVMKKKKKKTLIDARTKTYKEHQRRLQLARERREERKKKAAEKMNEEQLKEIKKASLQFSLGMNSDMMKAKKDLEKKGHKVKVSGNKMTVTAKPGSDIDRELSDIRNFYDRGVEIKAEQIEKTPMTFSQKVQEQIGGFAREAFLAENNMEVIKSIVKSKGAKDLKMKDGKLKMDAFTASAITQVYDKVNPTNKKKMEDLANGKKSDLMKLQALAMKFVK